MSSEGVLLKNDSSSRWGSDRDSGDDGCLEKVMDL